MSKLLAPLCVALTALMLLAGCDAAPATNSPSSPQNPPPIPPANTDVVVRWGVPDIYHISDEALSRANGLLAEKGFSIEFVLTDIIEYEQTTPENRPDIMPLGTMENGGVSEGLLLDGEFAPLDGFLHDNPEIAVLYSEVQWQSSAINGVHYTIPAWLGFLPPHKLLNPDIFSKSDLDAFDSPGRLGALLRRATKNTPLLFDGDMSALCPWLDAAYGVGFSHETGRAVSLFSEEGYGDIMRVLSELYKAGGVAENTDSFSICVTAAGSETILPTNYLSWQGKPFVTSNLKGLAVSVSSPRQAQALELLKFLYTDSEFAALLLCGEAGKDTFINEMSLGYGRFPGLPPSSDALLSHRPQNLGDAADFVQNNTQPSPFIGFVPDTRGFESTIDALREINNQWLLTAPIWKATAGEYEARLAEVTGRLKAAGIDEWLSELNRQLDEWSK
ncbi:hypothetical protein FACS189425_08380 [Clostridia bacterium]|nr:hypothetical protein FACS189425_08380 [Clostridia bacterium]